MGITKYFPQRWQLWASYIYPIILETTSSEVSEYLEVILTRGKIQLCTDKAVYSFEQRYDNFRKLFELMDLELINGKRVLCLGLGLGSVIQLISERSKNVQFTAVELDDEVIRLAEKYILHKVDADIEVIAADALIFMQMTQWEYDMICMDIFIDDEIPEVFMSKDFCSLLKGAVENSGIIIFNTPAFDKKVAKESTLFFNKMFKDVFPKARILKIHKNHMLLSSDHLLRE